MDYKQLYEQQSQELTLIHNELGWTDIPPTKEMLLGKIKEMKGKENEYASQEDSDKCMEAVMKFMEAVTVEKDLLKKEIEQLKKENEKLKLFAKYDKFKCAKCRGNHTGCSNPTCDTCVAELQKENEKLNETNVELGDENDKIEQENVKLKNNNQIVGFMLMDDFVRKGIEKTIDEGINQYTFNIGTGFYSEHILTYVKDVIIPHLTTYTNGDSQFSSYQNGLFYYNMDCMNPYEIECDLSGTYTFNRVESDEEYSDSD
tara:strand:- start:12 stop:788 length:777 start_codon:yes stop_codon:yes gene_type:complete